MHERSTHNAIPPSAQLPRGVTWVLEGQLTEASNVVLRLQAESDEAEDVAAKSSGAQNHEDHNAHDATDESPRAVYKPVRGERPLRDFPRASLAHREVAAYLVARAGGWSCVPETTWYDGDFGPGSLQRWVGPLDGDEQSFVDLSLESELHPQLCIIAGFEAEEGEVYLTHTRDSALAEVAALDIILNNADRKGSHLIETDGHLFAIDNGLSFHVEEKLRTVLWGWAGEELGECITARLRTLVKNRESLNAELGAHLSVPEIRAFNARVTSLLDAGHFPEPPQERYGLPWPPL